MTDMYGDGLRIAKVDNGFVLDWTEEAKAEDNKAIDYKPHRMIFNNVDEALEFAKGKFA